MSFILERGGFLLILVRLRCLSVVLCAKIKNKIKKILVWKRAINLEAEFAFAVFVDNVGDADSGDHLVES